ncbi:MAG: SDR family NAD(P)-dependent oxidoreductase [Candidatus Nitrosotenuis sp.]
MKKNTKSDLLLRKELSGKTILITGGAGSIGFHLTKKILEHPIRTVRVLDIDEHALFRLKQTIHDNRLRLLLGNVLDLERIEMATNGVDIIFHLAAIKNIEISEFNPIETIHTNVNGTINLIKMAIRNKAKKFLNISTDKAVEPSTLYGVTKQLSEKLVSWAGSHTTPTKFASVRIGNVVETRGNVFEVWDKESKNKLPLSITDPHMKRYFFHVEEAVDFILSCLSETNKGEIFVPKMKLFNIKDVASKISKKHKVIGARQGEKIKELLLSANEENKAETKKNMWIIRDYNV